MLFRNRLDLLIHALRILANVMAHQKRYVPLSFPQRRNPNRENVQSKIQSSRNCFSAVSCTRSRFVAATSRTSARMVRVFPSAQILLLQNPQQFGLQLQRNISHFVEKQRSPICQPKRPIFCATAPVKAPFS